MPAFNLPEPSGEISYTPGVQNSYGRYGCFYVGESEIEDPTEDVKYFAQMLADALAAAEYENTTHIDVIAAKARGAYYSSEEEISDWNSWQSLGEDYRNRWRSVVRTVLENSVLENAAP
jgi:hypothetical protein